MAVGGAKLALLLIHILSVAGNGYSSLQENNYGSDDHEHRKKLISSLKSGFLIGYVFSSVSILTIFMSYCVPWARLMKRKGNEVNILQIACCSGGGLGRCKCPTADLVVLLKNPSS